MAAPMSPQSDQMVPGMSEIVPTLVVEATDIVLKPFQTQREIEKVAVAR